ncbi:ArsR family transcriptional regulator [Rhodobacteraceae bacterium KMM 6894]|nr:ArsR family transcriptional regulator [Rhodobacteraceae bacterium KMM 6894]
MSDQGQQTVMQTVLATPPRAGHFIVTLYGDLVEPRGGTLWMGRVIALCRAAGLSETLVRTAMSRLVSAGQLIGERKGRRSYYRLTPSAKVEFAQAARVLFSPPDVPTDFAMVQTGTTPLPFGFVPLTPELAIGPYRGDLGTGLVMRASVDHGRACLPDVAENLWDLRPVDAAYRVFLARFCPLLDHLEAGNTLHQQDALVARLLLVDVYRTAVLQDPFLPPAALGADWPGWHARKVFLHLYQRLSVAVDSQIQQEFDESEGLILGETPQIIARRASVSAEAALENN